MCVCESVRATCRHDDASRLVAAVLHEEDPEQDDGDDGQGAEHGAEDDPRVAAARVGEVAAVVVARTLESLRDAAAVVTRELAPVTRLCKAPRFCSSKLSHMNLIHYYY